MSEDRVAAERRQIEQEIKGRTLCDLLAEYAAGHGDAPAMSWKRDGAWRTLSWREYRERVAEVAMGLAGLGVGKGDRGHHGHQPARARPGRPGRRPRRGHPDELLLHPRPEQIQYVAGHCKAKVAVLEDRDMLKRLAGHPRRPARPPVPGGAGRRPGRRRPGVLGWDELVGRGRDALAADRSAFEDLRGRVGPEDNATLLYTSGTTGPPKGVLLTHHNLLFECTARDRLTGLSPEGSSVSYLPLAHIAERVLSIYGPLTMRTHIWFCPEPTQAVEYVREARPTLFFGVPVWEKVQAGIQASWPPRRTAQAQDRRAGGGDRPRGRPPHPAGRARCRSGSRPGTPCSSAWCCQDSTGDRAGPLQLRLQRGLAPGRGRGRVLRRPACPWSRCTA